MVLAFCLMLVLSACSLGSFGNPDQNEDVLVGDDPLSAGIDKNPSREAQARSAVIDFYNALNQGEYQKAAGQYGGPYDDLQYFNPDIYPSDKTSLLQAGCEFNGIMCLQVLDVLLVQENESREFVYEVSFSNPDGSLFVLGPCCGATEEEMPPLSKFTVHVVCEDEGACLVLDLPPFVP